MSIHIGAKSALAFLGKAQYLELDTQKVLLFGAKDKRLPSINILGVSG